MLSVKKLWRFRPISRFQLGDEGFFASFSPGGKMLALHAGELLLSRTVGNPAEGGLARLYCRQYHGSSIRLHELVGPSSCLSDFDEQKGIARRAGSMGEVDFALHLQLDPESASLWWTIDLQNRGNHAFVYDIVWIQDIGNAKQGALESNEAYVAHYLDETVLEDERSGPVLAFRQNLPQGGRFPWLLTACLTGAQGFSTDAFDLFGNGYRCGKEAEALGSERLPNRRFQYEFSVSALQSVRQELAPGASGQTVFALRHQADHPQATSPQDLAVLESLRQIPSRPEVVRANGREVVTPSPASLQDNRLHGKELGRAELQDLYPGKWRHLEEAGGEVMSFFTGDESHVVTAAKEAQVERPHGTILVGAASGESLHDVLATTVYMAGIFSAQTVIGNTSFHCLNTFPREPLGLTQLAGLRIYLEKDGEWQALGVPSVFEMKRDTCKWIYQFDEGMVQVTVGMLPGRSSMALEIELGGDASRVLLANELTADAQDAQWDMPETSGDGPHTLICRYESPAHADSVDLVYGLAWHANGSEVEVGKSDLLGAEGAGYRSVIQAGPGRGFSFRISAATEGVDRLRQRLMDALNEAGDTGDFWHELNRGLRIKGEDPAVGRIADALRWYSHHAVIHYASPHGLEQYTGAAWGTRDACQGPLEFFIAQQHHELARSILLTTFKNQYAESGDWPQWFMHDAYSEIAQTHSHGDIVVWPLKALAHYLRACGDVSILAEQLPYLDRNNRATAAVDSLANHVARALDRIEGEFIPGTHLIRYGGGDWDDSLQPASRELAQRLVSGWTVALLAQSLEELREVLPESGLKDRIAGLAEAVREDYRKEVFIDGQVAGFLLYDESFEKAEALLHPADRRTGLRNRLIPMTRSIIAGLLTRDEAASQLQRIRDHLKFPDGVRLMDKPAPYRGGIETFFKRAESAANFGREIGLQYVHAHIRYAEALAKVGDAEDLYEALLTICPVAISESVPNAAMRQSNMYFSSSDGGFLNRADAAENFEKLRDGSVPVKGGWRLYSSGPGLYSAIVLRQFFGLRETAGAWIFDPVLPKVLDGVTLEWELEGRAVQILFEIKEGTSGPRSVAAGDSVLAAEREENPYRSGGLVVGKDVLQAALEKDSQITVRL